LRTSPLRQGLRILRLASIVVLAWFVVSLLPAVMPRGHSAAPPAQDQSAALAGHGRLLLVQDHRLLLHGFAAGDGTDQILLQLPSTDFVRSPIWLPDGSGFLYILDHAYTGDKTGDWGSDIWQANADGSNRHMLWAHDAKGADADGLTLSADGSVLLFGYTRTDLSPTGALIGQVIQVRRFDLTTGSTALVVDQASDPAISPDGTLVVYLDVADADNDNFGLWVRTIDGTGAAPLVTVANGLAAFFTPRFAPNGSTLLFAGVPTANGLLLGSTCVLRCWLGAATTVADGPAQDIWTVQVDGTNLTRVTNLAEDQPSAAWSADGSQVTVYASSGLYLLEADGSALTRLGDGHLHGQVAWLDR
ncbi:MAG: TolB family protein, partial [Dehalococcoidia bacterium]